MQIIDRGVVFKGDAWAEMGKFSVGLPTVTPLKNGDILVVYYAGSHPDCTNIQWAQVHFE